MNVYTAYQELQYINTNQEHNSQQVLWYSRILEFINHIHYMPEFKIGKPEGLSRRSQKEKSRMHVDFLDKGQLLGLANDDVGEGEDAEVVELEGIDVAA